MENQKSNSSLKAIIVVLAILLAGSLAYMYKISSDAKTTETALVKQSNTSWFTVGIRTDIFNFYFDY